MAFKLDPNLRPYATDRQWDLLTAWEETGSLALAAKKLGLGNDRGTIQRAKRQVTKRAAQHGYAPDFDLVHPVAPGMASKGTSIRYDGSGNIQQYWNKTTREGRDPDEAVKLPDPKIVTKLSTNYGPDGQVMSQWVAEKPELAAQATAWEVFAKELAATIEPAPPIERILEDCEADADDLLACYPIGDHHMGMLAWNKENDGQDYDLEIGERMLEQATNRLASGVPACSQALLAVLGDFFHYDSIVPVTPTSQNILDADSRFPKMIRVGVRALRYTIARLLQQHGRVHVIIEIGNHDIYSSVFIIECLRALYEKEPRVTINTSPKHYHYFQFGKVMIATHHGHGAKWPELPGIMATDAPEMWGSSRHRYMWIGHVHHTQRLSQKEFQGATVESFQILAPQDAWHNQKGYRAQQSMKALVMHREYGEVARLTVNPQMFE